MQNSFVENFNGRMRDERLDERLFLDLDHSRQLVGDWSPNTTPQCRLIIVRALGEAGEGRSPIVLNGIADHREDVPALAAGQNTEHVAAKADHVIAQIIGEADDLVNEGGLCRANRGGVFGLEVAFHQRGTLRDVLQIGDGALDAGGDFRRRALRMEGDGGIRGIDWLSYGGRSARRPMQHH